MHLYCILKIKISWLQKIKKKKQDSGRSFQALQRDNTKRVNRSGSTQVFHVTGNQFNNNIFLALIKTHCRAPKFGYKF